MVVQVIPSLSRTALSPLQPLTCCAWHLLHTFCRRHSALLRALRLPPLFCDAALRQWNR